MKTLSLLLPLIGACIFVFIFIVSYTVAMFSDSPNSGNWLIPFSNNLKLFFILAIIAFILLVANIFLKNSSGLVQDISMYAGLAIGIFLIVYQPLIFFSYTSFKKDNSFGKDYFHLYYKGKIIDSFVDKNSFIDIGPSYLKDNSHIYYDENPLIPVAGPLIVNEADIGTFQDLGYAVGEDKNNIYFKGQAVSTNGLDKKSFQVLDTYYGRDNNSIYYFNLNNIVRIDSADVSSFKVSENGYATDKNNKYQNTFYDFSINGKVFSGDASSIPPEFQQILNSPINPPTPDTTQTSLQSTLQYYSADQLKASLQAYLSAPDSYFSDQNNVTTFKAFAQAYETKAPQDTAFIKQIKAKLMKIKNP